MKRGRKKIEWTEEMLRELEMEYCVKGKSIQESAEKLGLSYGVVRRKLKELGWLREQRSAMDWTTRELERLRWVYCEEGLPLQDCARMFSASNWVVSAKLREMGVTISKSKSKRKEEVPREEDVIIEACVALYAVYEKILFYSTDVTVEKRVSYERLASRIKRLINDTWRLTHRTVYPKFKRRKR